MKDESREREEMQHRGNTGSDFFDRDHSPWIWEVVTAESNSSSHFNL